MLRRNIKTPKTLSIQHTSVLKTYIFQSCALAQHLSILFLWSPQKHFEGKFIAQKKKNAVRMWFGSTSVFTVAVETPAQSLLLWHFLIRPKASTELRSSQLLGGEQDNIRPAEQTMPALPQDLCVQLHWCLEGSFWVKNYNIKMKLGEDNDCQSISSVSGLQTDGHIDS